VDCYLLVSILVEDFSISIQYLFQMQHRKAIDLLVKQLVYAWIVKCILTNNWFCIGGVCLCVDVCNILIFICLVQFLEEKGMKVKSLLTSFFAFLSKLKGFGVEGRRDRLLHFYPYFQFYVKNQNYPY
jgi:hypothetical protein